jgi:cob(I)alamin adenosyltransferase
MPRITRVYTRTGDDGTTALGDGGRVPKDSLRVEAYGTVDELNSVLGVALSEKLDPEVAAALRRIQNELFHLGADLCVREKQKEKRPVPRIEDRQIVALEGLMDALSEKLAPLENFVLPGGARGAAALHVARTVCRRAERLVVALSREEAVGADTVRYLNRLSDALFVLARYENKRAGVPDVLWDSRA